MATGIKIYNDAGTVQIDESYANLVLLDKQTYTISTPVTTPFDYALAGDVVALAVKVYPETFIPASIVFSGGVWSYRLFFFNNPDTTGTCTFTIYAFGKPPAPTETVGLKVLDASSNLIFHSQFKPLRIVGVADATGGFTGPAGRTIAVLYLSIPLYGFSVFPSSVYDTYSARVSGGTVQTIRTTVATPGAVGFVRPGLYAAVDVTNY